MSTETGEIPPKVECPELTKSKTEIEVGTFKSCEDREIMDEPPRVSGTEEWKRILEEHECMRKLHDHLNQRRSAEKPVLPDRNLGFSYLDRHIFPLLLPALEDTLRVAGEWDCYHTQRSPFNGLDYLAELLWNRNPRHTRSYKTIYEIPFVKEWLKSHPRPVYPLSWLWTREQAAVVIQAAVRAYNVRKDPLVQEMRQFWKALAAERAEKRSRERLDRFLDAEQAVSQHMDSLLNTVDIKVEDLDYMRKVLEEVTDKVRYLPSFDEYEIFLDRQNQQSQSSI